MRANAYHIPALSGWPVLARVMLARGRTTAGERGTPCTRTHPHPGPPGASDAGVILRTLPLRIPVIPATQSGAKPWASVSLSRAHGHHGRLSMLYIERLPSWAAAPPCRPCAVSASSPPPARSRLLTRTPQPSATQARLGVARGPESPQRYWSCIPGLPSGQDRAE